MTSFLPHQSFPRQTSLHSPTARNSPTTTTTGAGFGSAAHSEHAPPIASHLTAKGVVFSGRLAAGKDTVAVALFEHLGVRSTHVSLGAALKDELDGIIDLLRQVPRSESVDAVVEFVSCTPPQAETLTGMLYECDIFSLSARDRTDAVRKALQFLGTDIRRRQDPDHWVRRAVTSAQAALNDGRWVFVTDCRFPNDVAGFQQLGLLAVRLLVDQQTQAHRLWERDALVLRPELVSHTSETALDDFEFDVTIDNNGSLSETVALLAAHPFFEQLVSEP